MIKTVLSICVTVIIMLLSIFSAYQAGKQDGKSEFRKQTYMVIREYEDKIIEVGASEGYSKRVDLFCEMTREIIEIK